MSGKVSLIAVLALSTLTACAGARKIGSAPGGSAGNGGTTTIGSGSAGAAGAAVEPTEGTAGGGAPEGGVGALDGGATDGGVGLGSMWPNQALLYKATLAAPPKQTNTGQTTDAPLLGNGDVGVAIFGTIDALTLNLHKNEFWSLSEAKVKAMEKLALAIPSMAGASYAMTEDIGVGEVTGTFTAGGKTITTKSWVQADDSTQNKVITQFTLTGGGSVDVSASLSVGQGNSYATASGSSGDTLYRDVRADSADTLGGQPTRRVRVAARVVGTTGTVAGDRLTFTIASGTPVSLVTGVMSNLDSATYQDVVLSSISKLAAADVTAFETAHRAWWDAFFRKSFIEIPDKTIEKQYYASLYLLACVSRTGEQAPGLWGNWVMRDADWNGDYTLNYNYEAPFYAAFPTNHVELADSYDKPVIDWVPTAQAQAMRNGWTGAYYRVHIGPLPNGSGDTNEWNQKFNGAFAISVMIMHYDYTRDLGYATRIYPTIKQVATFWQSYLVKVGTRYVLNNDAQHEGDQNPQMNGVMSLGFVRMALQGAIDMSTALGMDSDARAQWQDRLTNLSAFPTFSRNGQTVFRYTEVGRDWNPGNAIGIQHIYPASQVGLGSDPALLTIAQAMVSQMARWRDGNGTVTFYPAAARVGHDPKEILTQLDGWITGNTYPNLHIHTGGGGIENFNTVPSTIAEMLLQSFQGKLRLFADWPMTDDARFGDLRASGGFLVSSRLIGGVVQYVRVASESGEPVVLVNPWSGKMVRVYKNGQDAGVQSGAEITISTAKGDVLNIATDGTSFADIMSRLSI